MDRSPPQSRAPAIIGLKNALGPHLRRARLQIRLDRGAWLLVVSAPAAAVLALFVEPWLGPLVALAAVVTGVLRPVPSPRQLAFELDERLGTHATLHTALAMVDAGSTSAEAVAADAVDRLRHHDPATLKTPRGALPSIAGVLLCAALGLALEDWWRTEGPGSVALQTQLTDLRQKAAAKGDAALHDAVRDLEAALEQARTEQGTDALVERADRGQLVVEEKIRTPEILAEAAARAAELSESADPTDRLRAAEIDDEVKKLEKLVTLTNAVAGEVDRRKKRRRGDSTAEFDAQAGINKSIEAYLSRGRTAWRC